MSYSEVLLLPSKNPGVSEISETPNFDSQICWASHNSFLQLFQTTLSSYFHYKNQCILYTSELYLAPREYNWYPAFASSITVKHFTVATPDAFLFTIFSELPFCRTELDEKYTHANTTYTCYHMIRAYKYVFMTHTQSFHSANAPCFWSFWTYVHMGISPSAAAAFYSLFIILVYHHSTDGVLCFLDSSFSLNSCFL